jgi:hypothetical protein
MGHRAWGIGHGSCGIGHGAWGMGHWAWSRSALGSNAGTNRSPQDARASPSVRQVPAQNKKPTECVGRSFSTLYFRVAIWKGETRQDSGKYFWSRFKNIRVICDSEGT